MTVPQATATSHHHTIRDAVLRQLHRLDLAADAEPRTLLPLARSEINRLANGWRQLLTMHHGNAEGRCPTCPTVFRGQRWPCPVWKMAYAHLIGGGSNGGHNRPAAGSSGHRRCSPAARGEPGPARRG